MQSHTAIGSTLGFVAMLLLAACGGGGGGGGGTSVGTAPPTISTSPSPPDGSVNVAYAGFTFSVASGGAAPFSWSETGALPPGLSFNSNGELSGMPVSAGTYPITVTVTDSSTPRHTATASVSLVIVEPGDVVVTAVSPPGGTLSYVYPGFVFEATGGSPPFVWSVAGTVPPGLTLSSVGQLTGTPTSVGSWTFTVTAADSATPPKAGSQSFTVVIGRPADVAISSAFTLPAGVHGTPYPGFSFSATGGELPLHWSATGTLPPGLTVSSDGLLSGTPISAGSFTFTVTVTDNASTPTTASANFAVVITEPPPPSIAAAAPRTGTVGVAYPAFRFSAYDGLAPLVWSATGTLAGLEFGLDGVLSGTPVEAGHFPVSIDVKDALNQAAVPLPVTIRVSLARPAAAFTPTGSMTVARRGHTATLLESGKVLVAGGAVVGSIASAEVYDPVSGTFTAIGDMTVARGGQTATLLSNAALPNHGKVLIVGGDATGSAELYDPASGTFTATGSAIAVLAGQGHTATLLGNEKVLIVAGQLTTAAALYDPASGTFTSTGDLNYPRTGHTATLLLDGRVLIAAGGTNKAELYDPASGTFAVTGLMTRIRSGITTAARLTDGTVLVESPDATAETFDPVTGTFAPAGQPLSSTREATASPRIDGTVLVAGGISLQRFYGVCTALTQCTSRFAPSVPVSTTLAQLFAQESEGYTATGSLNTARHEHTATVLADGSTVLITGGLKYTASPLFRPTSVSHVVLSSAELYK